MDSERYPEKYMPIAGDKAARDSLEMEEAAEPESITPADQAKAEQYRKFCELREDFLLDYGYNTARAYWGDLDDILHWALERDKDPLALTEKDIRQYAGLLRRRKYSESTLRRRMGTLRGFYRERKVGSSCY